MLVYRSSRRGGGDRDGLKKPFLLYLFRRFAIPMNTLRPISFLDLVVRGLALGGFGWSSLITTAYQTSLKALEEQKCHL